MVKLVENPKEELAVLECRKIFEKTFPKSPIIFYASRDNLVKAMAACFLRGFEEGKKECEKCWLKQQYGKRGRERK